MATNAYRQPKAAPMDGATQTKANTGNNLLTDKLRMIVANTASRDPNPTKTSGIKIRGTGAATKGLMARGPMA